jgi:methanethiol S-methyltransferase
MNAFSQMTGVPELSSPKKGKGKLLREGIYGVVRHPRYLSAGLGAIGLGFFCNNVGLYMFLVMLVPVGWLIVTLEERELVDRFGDAYRQYQREVPPLIPRRLRFFGQ